MGLLGTIGNTLGGVLGGGSSPKRRRSELLPETEELYGQRREEAALPSDQFTESYVEEITPNLQRAGDEILGQAPRLTAGREASIFEDAIRNVAKRRFDTSVNDIVRSAEITAPAIQGQRAAETLGFSRNDAAYALDFANKQNQAEANRTFYRNKAIGNLLGGIGMGAGALLSDKGERAEGAQLGRAIGKGIGGVTFDPGTAGYL